MDIWHDVLLWICTFCGLCVMLYICTVQANRKLWKGRLGQNLNPKPNPAGNLPISVYIIQPPDTKLAPCVVHLNYDALLLKDTKIREAKLRIDNSFLHGSTHCLV